MQAPGLNFHDLEETCTKVEIDAPWRLPTVDTEPQPAERAGLDFVDAPTFCAKPF